MKIKRFLAILLAALTLFSLTACGQAQEEAPAGETVTLGQMQGGTYTNTYAGFACTLPEGWTYMTAEELQELPDEVDELLAGSELGDQAAKLEVIADMKAENEAELTSLNVQYVKHSTALLLAYKAMTEEQIIDSAMKEKDAMIESYKQAGIEASVIEKVKVQFAGQEHYALHTEATIQGVPYYTTQIFVYGKGLFGVTLTAASFMIDKSGDLLGMFTAA